MRDDSRNVRSQEEDQDQGTFNQEDLNVTSEQFEMTQNPEMHEISNNDHAKSEEEEIPDDEEDSIVADENLEDPDCKGADGAEDDMLSLKD